MIHIMYNKIKYGYIYFTLLKDARKINFKFQSSTEDPIPKFINFLNHVRAGEDFEQNITNSSKENVLCLSVKNQGNDKVNFEMYITKRDIIFSEIISRVEVVDIFEGIIYYLLNDKGFPYMYPCYHYLDENKIKTIKEQNTKKLLNQISKLDRLEFIKLQDKLDELLELYINKRVVKISDEGKIFLDKYKKMLKELKVPEEWIINDEKFNRPLFKKNFVLSEWRKNSILCHNPDELINFFIKNQLIGATINELYIPKGGLHDTNEILAMYACDKEGNTICLPFKSILIDVPLIICTDKGKFEIDFSENEKVFVNLNSISDDIYIDDFDLNVFFSYFVESVIIDIKYSTIKHLENPNEVFLSKFSLMLSGKEGIGFSKSSNLDNCSTVWFDIDTKELEKYNR